MRVSGSVSENASTPMNPHRRPKRDADILGL
jgi:hypothetical protein